MKQFKYLLFLLITLFITCGKVSAQTLADFNNSRYRAYTGNSANGTLIYDSGNGGKQGSHYINIPTNNGSVGTPLSIYNIVSANDALQSGIQESFIMSLQLCVSSPLNIFNTYAGSSSILRTQNIEYLYSSVSDRITCSVAGTTGYLTTHFIKYDTTTYNVSGDYAFENKFYLYNWYQWGYDINFNVTSIVVESSTAELLNTIEELKQNQTIINSNITLNNSIQQQITQQQNTNNKLDQQIQQDKEQHEEAQETRRGILGSLVSMINFINPLSKDFFAYKLIELLLDMLKSLFIPDDMDFVTNFVDALESKLGFIAAIPVRIIEFTMSLATATWSEFKSISFPSISIFGYNFWNSQEVDLTEAINIFKPFKYVTDVICVVICAQTLNKWRERFTGGGGGK